MSNGDGAIPALIIFLVGIALSLPDPINIGIIIMQGLQQNTEPGTFPYEFGQTLISEMRIIGIFAIILSLLGIIVQARQGKYF